MNSIDKRWRAEQILMVVKFATQSLLKAMRESMEVSNIVGAFVSVIENSFFVAFT